MELHRDESSELDLVIDRVKISARIRELGREIGTKLEAKERPLAIIILQGAFIFAADILREMPNELGIEIAFLRCQSYGNETHSSGKVLILQDLDPSLDLRGRAVLLIDDILDTGLTLQTLVEHLGGKGAKRILSCVLLQRKSAEARSMAADFVGFETGAEFFVGYGLDHAGKFRNLADLFALKQVDE